jgi:hypothetical protein
MRTRRGFWACRCDCGREKIADSYNLRRGHIVSCGCGINSRVADPVETKPEWHCYMSMLDRCRNTKSKNYRRWGAMGVRVCERWQKGFWYFFADVGPRPSPGHSLDRFPNRSGDYEPGNVRWATRKEQQRNLRTNKVIEFRGERRTMAEWAEVIGINYRTLKGRLGRQRWSVERALTTPA